MAVCTASFRSLRRSSGISVAEVPVTHHPRKYGTSKYRPTKILTEIPDLLTLFFLTKYTRRPLHFFGRIGLALFAVGFAILGYLSYLWTQGIGIGTRPLLMFGVLLVLIGGQTVFTGLIADLIVNVNESRPQEFPLKYASDDQERLTIDSDDAGLRDSSENFVSGFSGRAPAIRNERCTAGEWGPAELLVDPAAAGISHAPPEIGIVRQRSECRREHRW